MLKQLQFTCFTVFLLPVLVHSQAVNNKKKFNHIISIVKGDLNKDKLPDSVIVLQDTLDEKKPYRLQVFIKGADLVYYPVVENDSAIEAAYPNGKDGMLTGTEFSDINIKAGVLIINTQLLRGRYEHKFRYQNGYFALIGFMKHYSDGRGHLTITDFNLSTGVQLETVELYDTGKMISSTRKLIKINPLPNLQTFTPLSTNLY